jgi:hypothetical protein
MYAWNSVKRQRNRFVGESRAYTQEFVECDRTFDGVREVVEPNGAVISSASGISVVRDRV